MALTKVTEPMTTITSFDDSGVQQDIALLGFKVASNGSLGKYDLVDQAIDDFQDSSGIDASASTNELRQDGYVVGGATDSYLKLLMHFDEASNNDTSITPTVGPAFTCGNDTKVSNGSAKFGTLSGRWQSTTNQYIGATSSSDFDFGSGDFTVDFWVNFNGTSMSSGSANSFIQVGTGSTNDYWSIQANAGYQILFRGAVSGQGTVDVASGANSVSFDTTAGNWTHVAVTRASDKIYLFHNGTLLNAGGTAFAWTIDPAGSGNELRLATDSAGDWNTNFNGYIDEVRIRKGAASWTSSFTPPTSAHTTTIPGGDLTLVSTSTTAESTPTSGDIVMTYTNYAGTATVNTDLKAWISRDNGSTYTQATLSSEGTTGGHTILTAHNVDISSQPSGTSMRYKITTHNQSASKETRIQAVSLGWS